MRLTLKRIVRVLQIFFFIFLLGTVNNVNNIDFQFINTVEAAMRNLFQEFQNAVKYRNSEKIASLLKEGLTVQDAVQYTINRLEDKANIAKSDEEFFVSLINTLTQYKGDFKEARLYDVNGDALSDAILKAFIVRATHGRLTVAHTPKSLTAVIRGRSQQEVQPSTSTVGSSDGC